MRNLGCCEAHIDKADPVNNRLHFECATGLEVAAVASTALRSGEREKKIRKSCAGYGAVRLGGMNKPFQKRD